MPSLLPHQQPYAKNAPDRVFLVWETGTGKTYSAIAWLKDTRDSDALILCPNRVVKKWKQALKDFDTKATVLSPNEFKKTPHRVYSAIVIDEADEYASPLFLAKLRSQRTEHLYYLLKENPNTPRMLLTATPIRSSPANLHTLLSFFGVYTPWAKWQQEFYTLTSRPYLAGKAWLPQSDWREKLKPYLQEHCHILNLRDIVTEPSVTETIHTVKTPLFHHTSWEPAKRFFDEHQHEQTNKIKTILEISRGHRKVFIVAQYKEQLRNLHKELSKHRETILVDGDTKEQEERLLYANNDTDECFLIVQASLGAGFDADTFRTVIFASQSYSVRDFIQMKGRLRRIHNLHDVDIHYIHGGRCDKAVYSNIQQGKTFVPSEWEI